MRFALLLVFLALTGCAQSFPGGVAQTRGQAAAIAGTSCGALDSRPAKRWAAQLKSGVWHLWKVNDGVRIDVYVDAKTGTFVPPAVSCLWTPDDH